MIHGYPYTDFHELNLDYLLSLAQKSLGLHLETSGKWLKLVNASGEEVSKVHVSYAEMALQDTDGHNINTYILEAGTENRQLVFTKGNGEIVSITVPYSTQARNDKNGNDITSYVKEVSYEGKRIKITFGDGTTSLFRVPFATMAETDINDKPITSYVADIIPNDNKLQLIDGSGVVLKEITVPYATKARNDIDGDPIKSTYGHSLITGNTTVTLQDKTGSTLSEIVVPYSVKALSDVNDNTLLGDYGYHLAVNGKKVSIESHSGNVLNSITVPFATEAGSADNSFESVSVVGDKLVFTKHDGTTIEITVPYSVKALKDDLNNTLSHIYISNVVNDPITGKLSFYSADGSLVAEIVPTVSKAVYDSFNNRIGDYIRAITSDPNSDYITITHGTGDVDSLTVHYSTKAWKDTYGNVIGNIYIRSLAIETDPVTGLKVLVAYNGELSELFRIPLVATSAETDINGTPITDYVKEVNLVSGTGNELEVVHGDNTTDTIIIDTGSEIDINVQDNVTDELENISFEGSVYGITGPWFAEDYEVSPEMVPANQGTVLTPSITLPTDGSYIVIAYTNWAGSNNDDSELSTGIRYDNSSDPSDPENGTGSSPYYDTGFTRAGKTSRQSHIRIISGKANSTVSIQVRTDDVSGGAVSSRIIAYRLSIHRYS